MTKPSHDTWILVADASRARLFSTEGMGKPWHLLEDRVHPAGRLSGQEIMADRPGRVALGSSGARSAMEPHTDPRDVEEARFADELGDVVKAGLGQNAFRELVLVAPPHFLGLLREAIGEQARRHVKASVGKDFCAVPDHELPGRVEALI